MLLYVAKSEIIYKTSHLLGILYAVSLASLPGFPRDQIRLTLGISKVINRNAVSLPSALYPFLDFLSFLVIPAKSRSRGTEVCRLVDKK